MGSKRWCCHKSSTEQACRSYPSFGLSLYTHAVRPRRREKTHKKMSKPWLGLESPIPQQATLTTPPRTGQDSACKLKGNNNSITLLSEVSFNFRSTLRQRYAPCDLPSWFPCLSSFATCRAIKWEPGARHLHIHFENAVRGRRAVWCMLRSRLAF